MDLLGDILETLRLDLLPCNWSTLSERVRLICTPKEEEEMSRQRYTPEQIIGFLREAEMRLSQG